MLVGRELERLAQGGNGDLQGRQSRLCARSEHPCSFGLFGHPLAPSPSVEQPLGSSAAQNLGSVVPKKISKKGGAAQRGRSEATVPAHLLHPFVSAGASSDGRKLLATSCSGEEQRAGGSVQSSCLQRGNREEGRSMALVIKDLAQACCHPQPAGSSCPDQPCMVSNGDWVGCLQRMVLQMCSHIKHFPSRKACQAQPARSSAWAWKAGRTGPAAAHITLFNILHDQSGPISGPAKSNNAIDWHLHHASSIMLA